jgi:hypothetical protein
MDKLVDDALLNFKECKTMDGKKFNTAFIVTTILLLSSCSTTGKFVLLSTTPSENIDSHTVRLSEEKISKESCLEIYLLVPSRRPVNSDDLIKDLIHQVPGTQAMTEVTVETKRLFTILYDKVCMRMSGYPVVFK